MCSLTGLLHVRYECVVETANAEPSLAGRDQIGRAVPRLRQLVAGLPSRRPGFNPGSVHVGFVVDKVALGQVFPRVLRFSPVNVIPPVLHYLDKRKKLIIFLFIFNTRLHNKP
jgi:hypothetical protein